MHEDAGKTVVNTNEGGEVEEGEQAKAKRPGSAKKSKTVHLHIDSDCIIAPTEPIPPGSRFKGYRDFTV
jgi:hypothetical protein